MTEKMLNNMRILTDGKKTILVKNLEKDFSTHKGVVKKEDLKKEASLIKTTKGYEFFIFKPKLSDIYNVIIRKPQIILQKDLGFIIAFCGINKNSIILEAGTGTGATAIVLANISKKVISYEKRKEHYEIAKRNIELFGVENVVLKQKDIYDGIEEKNIDLILLDLPEPWNAVEHSYSALKPNGFLVVYLPNLTQVKTLYEKLKDFKFYVYGTKVIYEQNWFVDDKILRPINKEYLTFTAFLTIARKYV